MHQAIHTQIPDYPTFDLNDDFALSSSPSLPDLPQVKPGPAELAMTPQGALTRSAVKIARAIRGDSEVRLLVEKSKGKTDRFLLEVATFQPYTATKTPLVTRGGAKKPLAELAAVKAFNETVATKYPAEKLRSGRLVPIHQNLL